MRRVQRTALPARVAKVLARKTAQVAASADPRQGAQQLWRRKPKATFAVVRATLIGMASGRARCMYCEDSAGTDIEHFKPQALYPHDTFSWRNYLWACSFCNSNAKRTFDPIDQTGQRVLIDPSVDDPADHLAFSLTTGAVVALTSIGENAIRVFGLNDDQTPRRLKDGRRDAYFALRALLFAYDQALNAGDEQVRLQTRAAICNQSFASVADWLVRAAYSANADVVIGAPVAELVKRHNLAELAAR